MDSLKLPKGNSPNSSASGSNSNLSAASTSASASASAATSPTSSANVVTGMASSTKSPPGLSNSTTPISVRFNANEESLDDILQSFHHSKLSPSGGASGGGDASPTSTTHNLLGMKNNGLGLSGSLVVGSACDSLSSSPSAPQMQAAAAALFGTDEVNMRNSFLQGGGFFNRKSCSGLPPNLNLSKPPQLHQPPQQQHQQLSPNLSALHHHHQQHHQQHHRDGGSHSPSSPVGGGGGSPYNGSQAGCSSGGISPIPQMSGVSPKYRRSISFPIKGNSPTAMYGGPHGMDGLGCGQMNIPTLSIGNGAGSSGGMVSAGATGGGDAPYLGNSFGSMMAAAAAANGQMHHGMDNSLSEYMRGMTLGSGLGGGLGGSCGNGNGGNGDLGGSSAMSLMQDRMRILGGPKHLSEADAIAIAASGNDPSLYLNALKMNSPSRLSPHSPHSPGCLQGNMDGSARFSRKVFVGGLPPDIDEDEITTSFRRFGPLVVDWPHKAESKSYFPPKGYAFLLFQDESSVQALIDSCITDEDKLYLCVSSPTIKDKAVQIRPWRLADADYVLDATMSLDPRKTVFVGGVPRPLKAFELAMIMDRLYGGVCYAGIDTDPELKYPKGAGRVAFSNQQSYIAAISARFVQLQHGDIDKRVEVKPYVLDDQMCDECEGQRCGGKFAPFFCANVTCLQYYCEHCWAVIHSRPGREYHKPLVKEGADRPRAVPFRWC
ncbi:translational regulator orb2-like isoform X5 [Drosophila bipectinata]|uniref:translational regulator orb2-like isoform X5 n=1 Tax=Drosophila bipectinata TaxID=42026 RepID=UPI0007E6BD19|nr:translational regulator orb2-like isoform X1 [Drosophila bipectinata]XP_043067549.1 translational regulator orb2-like isoform X1 [Drosophila bipectinata]XP_043067555.1 translational regulator orb2-like isoform X1 [Drosophila bipectinata]XP_043067560.1 translational regulator orb2-like isoform X1 [Drosophila bipectinata]